NVESKIGFRLDHNALTGGRKLRVAVIFNPNARHGRAAEDEATAVRALTDLGVDFDLFKTSGPGDAISLAQGAAEQGYDVVCAMGGDGTVNEVINGIARTGAALAVIPVGTGNDFSGALGVPKGDVAAACRILARGHRRPMDLCRANDRYFACSFGAGFDARVGKAATERFKRFGGIWTYIFAFMSVIWTFRPGQMRIVADGREISKSPLLVAVTNWKSYGGGMYICPDARIDDGLLDVCIIDNVPIFKLLCCFPRVIRGAHVNMPEVEMLQVRSVQISCSRMETYHVDGEVFEADHIELALVPGGIDVVAGEV
ncbi:MAG: diacylglycerol kinase family lipid kinase, partial [Firmicutes bacterium]|nr:diacylglycerol kinase family lipid kinase [Bacillota bacterium]